MKATTVGTDLPLNMRAAYILNGWLPTFGFIARAILSCSYQLNLLRQDAQLGIYFLGQLVGYISNTAQNRPLILKGIGNGAFKI